MLHFYISDPSEVAFARRRVTGLAQSLGLTATDVGNVALIVTEMGTNILKHAVRGELIAQETARNQNNGIELLALDTGPGMANVAECLRDGYSTAGSSGTGLGAIVRTSTLAEIFSLPGRGTAVFAQIVEGQAPQLQFKKDPSKLPSARMTEEFTTGVVSVAKTGQVVCGDGWAVSQQPPHYRLLVADGLGHGLMAAEASQRAIQIFHQHVTSPLGELFNAMHRALRSTRGAVVAVAEINRTEQQVHYCGVGNIGATLLTGQSSRSLVSLNGIVGHQLPTLREFSYPWNPQTLLVMHSDGLGSRWTVEHYPALLTRHPTVVAGVLYRDFSRGGRDDVTVAVARPD
jgi:anti-sigma regulatory factor (Ser/Thr protein kinase)